MAPFFPFRRLRRRRPLRARPQVSVLHHPERLEDRTLLAAFAVSTEADTFDVSPGDGFASDSNGATSLRAAIQEANALAGDDVIVLPSGSYTLTRTGIDENSSFTGDLDVTSNLIILGAGAGRTFIDANEIDRVLDVRPGASLILRDVTLRNGSAIHSAGIRNSGTLELIDSVVTGNDATGAVNSLGGGIGNASGNLTLTRVTVTGNTAEVHGGGLYSSGGSVVISDSTFSGNSATLDGGGISVFNGTLQITDSTISGNVAGVDGGGLSADAATVTVTRTTVSGNTATEDGGGLNVISNGELRIFDSTISGNIASSGFGGGIRSFSSVLGVTRTTVSGNQTARSGGGIDNDSGLAEITNSLIAANTASENGGGINAFEATTGLSNTTVSANTATLNGGGIQNSDQSSLTVVSSTLTGNVASTGFGGGINDLGIASLGNTVVAMNSGTTDNELSGSFSTFGSNLIREIGFATGFSNGTSGDIVGSGASPVDAMLSPLQDNGGATLSHALLAGSPAIDAGNGNGVASIDQTGQSRVLDGDADGDSVVDIGAVEYRDGRRTFFVSVTIDSTDSSLGDGLAQDASGATSLRAAIQEANALTGPSRIVLSAGVFQLSLFNESFTEADTGNSSGIEDLDITGLLTITGAGQDQTMIDGGDLYRVIQIHAGAQVVLRDLTIRNGRSTFGAGIYNGGGLLILEDVTVTGSSASGSDTTSHGGGIAVDAGSLSLTRATVTGNSAAIDGGGIYAFNSAVLLDESSVLSNSAVRSGGGIAIVGSDVQITNSTIAANTATDDGGGAAIGTGSTVFFETSSVEENMSGDYGGGLHVIGASVSLLDSTVAGNSAATSGGGINNEQSSITLSRSTVHSNSATVSGGGIDNFDGFTLLSLSTISGNSAGSNGGGVVNFSGGTIEFLNSTITNNTAAEFGGGLWTTGTARAGNSIIAQNAGGTGSPDINGAVASLGTNLVGNGVGSSGLVNGIAGNLVGTTQNPIDAGLSPLQDNGGPTLTHLPLFGSAAIDAGSLNPGTTVDQRGHTRFGAGDLGGSPRSDIGAVEFVGLSFLAGLNAPINLVTSREDGGMLITNSVSGKVLFRIRLDEIDQVQVTGGTLDDSLVVDLATGNPLPVGGFEFFGGANGTASGDSLTLLSGSAETVSQTIITGVDGRVLIDGRAVIYTQVESLSDSVSAQFREFHSGDGLDSIVVADAGSASDGTMSITRSGGSLIEFLVPTTRLTLTDSGGLSVVRFDSLDDLFAAAVSISTGDASDRIDASILSTDVSVTSGAGNDTIVTGSGNDWISSEAGNDLIEAGAGNDFVMSGSQIDTINGGAGDDTLLAQGGSRDVLIGGPGDDILHGGSGADYVQASADTDFTLTDSTLTGEGNDILINIEWAELTGGAGNNRIDASGFSGPTTLEGGDGDDVLIGGSNNDRIFDTGSGDDWLEGNGGSDILIAGRGRDTVLGGAGDDFVLGNGGSGDLLSGGPGADVINGGAGIDILFETFDVDLKLRDTRLIGPDIDRLYDIEQARLVGGESANVIDAGRFSGMTMLYGMGGDDFLIGSKSGDLIFGGEGNDSVLGRAGDDTIFGEAGNDTLKGDGGNDSISGGTGNDGIAGRTDNDTLIGDEGDDTLVGESGSDQVIGGADDDTVYGGTGADTVIGNGGVDKLGGSTGGRSSADSGDVVSGFADEIDEAFIVLADWIFQD